MAQVRLGRTKVVIGVRTPRAGAAYQHRTRELPDGRRFREVRPAEKREG